MLSLEILNKTIPLCNEFSAFVMFVLAEKTQSTTVNYFR